MKALLILLFVSFAKGAKLNSIYLPPPGANYSRDGGDVEVPFEVPVENFGTRDESETRLTPGIFRDRGIISSTSVPTHNGRILSSTYAPTSNKRPSTSINVPASDERIISSIYKPSSNGIISSTYAPTTYPSTNLNYNSYSTTSRPSSNEVIDGLSNQSNSEKAFVTNQDSDKKDGSINLPYSSENQLESDNSDFGRPVSFDHMETDNDNGGKILFYSNKKVNKVKYPENKIRPQAEAERNAVILNYENVITPDGFAYSFDTSNGIHADESGTASDGVKANGSYSYIGDDGKLYNITYSADEYGFQPRGNHLPTPPPVPDAILKVIEQAAKDRDNGIFDDGSYDENKYGFKKYQPVRNRILGNNDHRLKSSPTLSGLSFKEPSKISGGSTIYKPDEHVLLNSQGDNNNNENQKGTKFIEPKKSYNQDPNEFVRDNNDEFYQNLNSQEFGFPSTIRIPGNKINIYSGPMDGTINEYNNLPSIINKENNRNNYDTERISEPSSSFVTNDRKVNEPDFENTLTESQNGYSYPNPNRQFVQQIPNQPSKFDQNKYNEPGFTRKPNQFAVGKPTEYYSPSTERIKEFGTDTVQPNNYYSPSTEKIKEFGAYTDQPNNYYRSEGIKQVGTERPTNFYSPSSTERARDSTTFTDRPRDYYNPSTDRLSGYDVYTDRPRDYYNPSSIKITSTERIKPTSSFIQPIKYNYSPSTTEIQQIGTYYTDRPNNNYYRPTSTETANEFVTYTDRPNGNFYSPSIGRVMELDIDTGKPSIYYGPVRPKSYYGPLSTQGTSIFDKITGRPSDYYNYSSSTERKDIDKNPVQFNDYYSPSSTEKIKEFETATGGSIDYYSPSSSPKIKDFGAATGRPIDYYAASSTERTKDIGTATGRPSDYYAPSSTQRINDFGAATGRPIDYYAASSTERIKDIGTATGRQTDYYPPSSTERIKDFGTATGRPTDYYAPSSTERIKDFGTATGRQTDYYAPSSTERIKDFETSTGRQTDYYAPSSTERIKDFGTATGRPTDYYTPSSTERALGEDFSGPEQPQRYDPETGYHY